MRRRHRRHITEEFVLDKWQPRTKMGQAVKEGKITDIAQILRRGTPIKESGIVSALVPNIKEDILEVKLVQRMHKSGRRVKYRIVVVVGNHDGIVGVGHASARDIGTAIRKAVNTAKINVIEIARGCGSWECMCGRGHSVPFEVSGKSGSTKVSIKPAPRGLGLAMAEVPKIILRAAGIQDAWTRSGGETRTTLNFALTTLEALRQTTKVALSEKYKGHVIIGKAGGASG